MEIPYTELSAEALTGVIEEFISREGTEYGAREYSMDEKIEQVMRQLAAGEVKIFFDDESQSCNLVRAS
ncbi:MAG: YheU family protein [Gammaproteobacteria bacterium]|nr:YheU family protein [Gammaproteobacteria bacterium]MDD9895315.1 YheU family protein [Gammaproteobacteria bacterium]MDD9960232.1 YheU family protein [Gammaproteobacteria bacterium]